MPKDRAILTVPNDNCYLPIIRAFVKAVAAQTGFDSADIDDIQLAVDEAWTHVVETAFEPGEAQDTTISCERSPKALLIAIADQGMPVDPRTIPEYDARGGLNRDLSGLPFHRIQSAMHEIHFENRGWKGKELQPTKYLKVPSV